MSSQKPSNHLCKIRICCLIGKLIFVIPWETGKRAGASKAKTGTSGLMMLDQMSRNKCNSSHYVHNWETGKIAPLEQWGTPTNTPGTALDNRGGWVGWGGGSYWEGGRPAHNNAAHYATNCPLRWPPKRSKVLCHSMDTNAFTLNVQLYMGHVTWLSMVFFPRAVAWIGTFHTVLCKNGHEIRTKYLKQLRVDHILCYHEWESVF